MKRTGKGLILPYVKTNEFKIVKSYINGIQVHCMINLDFSKTYFNSSYFKENGMGEDGVYIRIRRFNCYFLRKENVTISLIDLTKYEKESGLIIHGILGRDFINNYYLINNNEKDKVFVFEKIGYQREEDIKYIIDKQDTP